MEKLCGELIMCIIIFDRIFSQRSAAPCEDRITRFNTLCPPAELEPVLQYQGVVSLKSELEETSCLHCLAGRSQFSILIQMFNRMAWLKG